MDEQGYRFGVGVLVVASLVIVVILILFFGAAPNFFAQRYHVTINFKEAPGVEVDTPVRKNGVMIGRVTDIQLLGFNDNREDQGVNLTLELNSKVQVQASEVARIGIGSLITGDAVIEFVQDTPFGRLTRFDGMGGSPKDGSLDTNEESIASTYLKEGDYMANGAGKVAPDPFETLLSLQDSLQPTFAAIKQASDQVNGLALDIRRVIGNQEGGPIQQVARKAELTMDNFNKTMNELQAMFQIVNNERVKLAVESASEKFPQLITDAQEVLKQGQKTLASFEGVGKAAEETVKNAADFTKPLAQKGDQIVNDAIRTLNTLDQTLNEVRQIAGRVNNSQGSLKKLLEDEQLYYSLVGTLNNVQQATQRLQPILEDARIFSDKIARDPSQVIGLRNAINGRAPGLGVK
jgi:phospholipid/cholesterol/gamma-HCH transport system substrate-binding protein